jgi:hypothetical protein
MEFAPGVLDAEAYLDEAAYSKAKVKKKKGKKSAPIVPGGLGDVSLNGGSVATGVWQPPAGHAPDLSSKDSLIRDKAAPKAAEASFIRQDEHQTKMVASPLKQHDPHRSEQVHHHEALQPHPHSEPEHDPNSVSPPPEHVSANTSSPSVTEQFPIQTAAILAHAELPAEIAAEYHQEYVYEMNDEHETEPLGDAEEAVENSASACLTETPGVPLVDNPILDLKPLKLGRLPSIGRKLDAIPYSNTDATPIALRQLPLSSKTSAQKPSPGASLNIRHSDPLPSNTVSSKPITTTAESGLQLNTLPPPAAEDPSNLTAEEKLTAGVTDVTILTPALVASTTLVESAIRRSRQNSRHPDSLRNENQPQPIEAEQSVIDRRSTSSTQEQSYNASDTPNTVLASTPDIAGVIPMMDGIIGERRRVKSARTPREEAYEKAKSKVVASVNAKKKSDISPALDQKERDRLVGVNRFAFLNAQRE